MSNTQEWKWKRWDVRADGKVFWAYNKNSKGSQRWVTWEHAIRLRQIIKTSQFKYSKKVNYSPRYTDLEKRKKYIKTYNRIYEKTRRSKDTIYDLIKRLRCRIRSAVTRNGYAKNSKTKDTVGCSWDNLKAHIESGFIGGMSWDNRHLWHIDHIIPLSSAKSEQDLIKLNHYTNLQPLWAKDNLKKGATIQK